MEITTDLIKTLREKTGVGMMDCKKALQETLGDLDKAVDYLRKQGIAAVARRAERKAAEGLIDSYIHIGGQIGVIVEVNCETDFVARNVQFQAFAKEIAMQVAAQNPQYLTRQEVPAEIIEHERDVLRAQASLESKKPETVEKIAEGRLQKFFSEICLLDQPFIKDPDKTIQDLLGEFAAKIGENIVIRRFVRFQVGEKS